MKTAIIIPVKKHSRRCPGKNFRTLGGMTLLERAIKTALATGKDVYVSCSDDAVLDEIQELGAKPIKRPDELDHEGYELMPHVMRHAIETVPGYTHYCLLQVTNPFVTPQRLQEAMSHHTGVAVQDAGAFYHFPSAMWFDPDGVYRWGCKMFRIHPSVDIDCEHDFKEAEELMG